MRVFSITLALLTSIGFVVAQNRVQAVSITSAFGSNKASFSVDYFNNWQFGSAKKNQVGLGAWFTSLFGSDQEYTSALATLANEEANVDTVQFSKSQVIALNLCQQFSVLFGKAETI